MANTIEKLFPNLPPVEHTTYKKPAQNPIDKIFREQKTKIANKWCLHKSTELRKMTDYKNDEIMEIEVCSKCGKEIV